MAWGFLRPAEPRFALRFMYSLYAIGALALVFFTVAASDLTPHLWLTALVLGLAAWAANNRGFALFEGYTLSLELALYLFGYLFSGYAVALVAILVSSLLLAVEGMIRDRNYARYDFLFRKLSNTMVLGTSLLLAISFSPFIHPAVFFSSSFIRQLQGAFIFWLVFTVLNNVLFLPMDLADEGLKAIRLFPKQVYLDGSVHGLSVLSGVGFSLLYRHGPSEAIFWLLPVVMVLILVLKRLTEHRQRLKTQVTLVQKLNKWSTELHGSLEMPAVLDVVRRMSEELFSTRTYFIALLDERASTVQFAIAMDHGVPLEMEDTDLDRGLTGRVLKTGEPLFFNDFPRESKWKEITHTVGDSKQVVRSIMLAPFKDHGRTIGVFSLQRDEAHAFKSFHRELFLSAIQQIATAVVSARLYKRATQDGLTRLYNKSYFEESLAACLANQSSFGLLFLDCDDFKAINDRFGHPEGDRYLKVLGEGILQQCRTGDIPCRYGGDEFAILLKQADVGQTRRVAERILEAVNKIEWMVSGEPVHTTASIGLLWSAGGEARMPVEDVIRVIDKCLYRAKKKKHCIEETILPALL